MVGFWDARSLWAVGGHLVAAAGALWLVVRGQVELAGRSGRGRAAAAGPSIDSMAERPYEVAHLNGGRGLTLRAAMAAMHRRGTLAATDQHTIVAVGRTDPLANGLERALHGAAEDPTTGRTVARDPEVVAALDDVEARLVADGLMADAAAQARVRALPLVLVPLGVLGPAWFFARLAPYHGPDLDHASIALPFIAVLMAGVVLVGQGVFLRSVRPRPTHAGTRALRHLAEAHRDVLLTAEQDATSPGPTHPISRRRPRRSGPSR